MEGLARNTLEPGQGFEWTEIALQERLTGNTALYIFALSIVFVFLALSAQYESWVLPMAIMLIVPISMLFALGGVWASGIDNNLRSDESRVGREGVSTCRYRGARDI